MWKNDYVFTSESVSEGHPDKVCDRISDAIVDAFLTEDPTSRVAVETMCTTNFIVLAGEVRGPDTLHHDKYREIARQAVRESVTNNTAFTGKTPRSPLTFIRNPPTSPKAWMQRGNKDEGAGDQGIMFGYACRETDVLMPAPIYYSHAILASLAEARHSGAEPGLGPDAKSQVTLRYVGGKPVGATALVVSTQHSDKLSLEEIREIVRPHVVNVLPEGWMCDEDHFYVNQQGASWLAAPMVTLALLVAKSLLIPMVAQRPMGAVPSQERTQPKWTVREHMPPGILRRTLSRRKLRTAARSNFRMLLESRILSPFM